MTLQLILLVALIVLGVSVAVWAGVAQHPTATVAARIRGETAPVPASSLFLSEGGKDPLARFGAWLADFLPDWFMNGTRAQSLVQAGFTSRSAPAIYLALQLALAVAGMLLMLWYLSDARPALVTIGAAMGLAVGWFLPAAVVARLRHRRQDRIVKGLPDALDLMLVCVEAGISLDASFVRVASELNLVHPEFAAELAMVSRKQNAGVPREEALRGMWVRTGVVELRALSASLIQSERWGTSISRVLRVESEGLRRERRERAEHRAALAGTKMIFPLALLILPGLLIVIGGPMMIQIAEVFNGLGK